MALQLPTSLGDLLAACQYKMAMGVPQPEIVEFAMQAAAQCGVRAHVETLARPATAETITAETATAEPAAVEPATAEPAAVEPTAAEPAAVEPATAEPAAVEPATAELAEPTTAEPATAEPATAEPATTEPATAETAAAEPAEPATAEEPAAAEEPGATGSAGDETATKRRRRRGKRHGRAVVPVVTRRDDGAHLLEIGATVALAAAAVPAAPAAPITRHADPVFGRLGLNADRHISARSAARLMALHNDCAGIVIDTRTWRVLAAPPRAVSERPPPGPVNRHLADGLYDVIPVDDGTVLTLYSWEHPTEGQQWALASNNGYDVSGLRWVGGLTWAAALFDVLQRCCPEFVALTGAELAAGGGRLLFGRLDAGRSYTLGFRHHAFHPLRADPERAWQIQSADVTGPLPWVAPGPYLPGIPAQRVWATPGGPLTVAQLVAIGEQSLARAAAACAAHARGDGAAPPPGAFHYGFILRSRAPCRTREHSDVLLPSPLLARLRRLVYERPPAQEGVAPEARAEYSAWRAFLMPDAAADFLALFPERAGAFAAYREAVAAAERLAVHALRQRALGAASRDPALRSPLGAVAQHIAGQVQAHEPGLAPWSRDAERVVHDFAVDPRNARLFMNARAAP